jgi:hypothetical protein
MGQLIYLKIKNKKRPDLNEFCWFCQGDGYLIKGGKGQPSYPYRCECALGAKFPNYPFYIQSKASSV